LAEYDLESLAAKFRARPPNVARLQAEEISLLHEVRQAHRSLDRVLWWFGDLDSSLTDTYGEFVRLHEHVTALPAFRTLAYEPAADPNVRTFLAEHDRGEELRELADGKNLGYGMIPKRDAERVDLSVATPNGTGSAATPVESDSRNTVQDSMGKAHRAHKSKSSTGRGKSVTKTRRRKSTQGPKKQ
jgi:hypothetical protein